MTQVENAAIITFGAFDRGGQFSTALANFITQGSGGFKQLEADAFEMGISVRSSIEGLASSFDPLFERAGQLFAYIQQGAGDLSFDWGRELRDLDNLTDFLANKTYAGRKLQDFGVDIGRSDFEGRYRREQKAAERRLRGQNAEREVSDLVGRHFDRFMNPVGNSPAPRPASGGSAKPKGRGRSAEAEARRAENERLRSIREAASKERENAILQEDINAAKAALAVAADDILRFSLQQIDSEKQQRLAEYETQRKLGQLTDQELVDRRAAVEEIAQLQKRRVQQMVDENKAAQARDAFRSEADTLEAENRLATTRRERLATELRILDLRYQEEESALRSAAAAGRIANLDEELAKLRRRRVADESGIQRDNEGPLASYARGLRETDTQDQIESYIVDELQHVQDGISSALSKAIGTKDPLITGLIEMFIQQVIMKPIADALAQAGGGGGGFFGSVISGIGSLFGGGRAIGGPVKAGVPYMVGENGGPRGRELFVPQQAGVIVPNHRIRGGNSGAVINQTFVLDARHGITTPELIEYVNSTANARAVQASSAMGKAVLKAVPGRLSAYQRDGV